MGAATFWFGLEIRGALSAAFSHFTIASAVELVGDGSNAGPPQVRRIPPTVTLSRRIDQDLQLFAWHQSVVDGAVETARQDCTVIVFDVSGATVARFALDLAWPLEVVVGPLQVGEEDTLGETVTLRCENVRRLSL
jgi:phage tail-like protein